MKYKLGIDRVPTSGACQAGENSPCRRRAEGWSGRSCGRDGFLVQLLGDSSSIWVKTPLRLQLVAAVRNRASRVIEFLFIGAWPAKHQKEPRCISTRGSFRIQRYLVSLLLARRDERARSQR